MEITEQNKYSTKDITQWTREQLKQKYPDLKLSITCQYYSGGSSMSIAVMESKKVRFIKTLKEVTDEQKCRIQAKRNLTDEQVEEFLKLEWERESKHNQINHYYIDHEVFLTDKAKEILKDIYKTANHYNYDKSDVQIDYFDVNYYFHLSLGKWDKPFIDGKEE